MSRVFLDILIVIVAAKLAAEIAERVKIPAVVGEIIAGIIIGPSALGLIKKTADGGSGDVLHILGELGVILLLLEVGMHMDLRELQAVGRSAMQVATVGVVLPMVAGLIAGELFGLTVNQALFVGSALAATSVGITARVFGDLRALSSVEARTVLGAAVADDVMGLVILTVVVRIATGTGSVSVGGVLVVIAVAMLFLVLTTAIGSLGAPRLFALIDRHSRSSGTLFALALAFTLAIAELASASKLAPIVGAFVAGLALGRTTLAPRIQRELTPVGHLFIPVFFLQIGIDVDVKQFVKPSVIGLASALIVVAVLGKVAAGFAASKSSGDRLLIGIGMIPRGEVGLIFAGVGLRSGVLGNNTYAAILLMVLVTTLLTPPILSIRLKALTSRRAGALPVETDEPRPIGGWTLVEPGELPRVVLAINPPQKALLAVAIESARKLESASPSQELLDWVSALSRGTRDAGPRWDSGTTEQLLHFLKSPSDRSWRFLETTGLLDAALPELMDAFRRRPLDLYALENNGIIRWSTLGRVAQMRLVDSRDHQFDVRSLEAARALVYPHLVCLAALLIDATRDLDRPASVAEPILDRLVLSETDRRMVGRLVSDQHLLRSAALRRDGLYEDSVLRIAAHLGTVEEAHAQYVLSVAMNGLEVWEVDLLSELHSLIVESLSSPSMLEMGGSSVVDRSRDEAIALLGARAHLVDRVTTAPLAYLISEDSPAIARHVALLHPLPPRGKFRVNVYPESDAVWRVEVGARDQVGLLALVTGVLEEARLDVVDAVLATWGDGAALQAFRVRTDIVGLAPSSTALESALIKAEQRDLVGEPVSDAVVSFDDTGSPWHSIAEVRATDRRGLLHALAVAFAAAGADVHAARITTHDFMALDRFDLTDRDGHKLTDATKAAIRSALSHGVVARPFRRRIGRTSSRVGELRKRA